MFRGETLNVYEYQVDKALHEREIPSIAENLGKKTHNFFLSFGHNKKSKFKSYIISLIYLNLSLLYTYSCNIKRQAYQLVLYPIMYSVGNQ